MFGTHHFLIFLMAGIALNLFPGPDTIYIIGRSITQGRTAGFLSALGIGTGCLVHTTAAAFGLSALLVTSAFAFNVVKFAGAAYLVYLGFQMFFSAHQSLTAHAGKRKGAPADLWVIYKQGFLTNLLNPKVALFFMAFLPQFVVQNHSFNPLPFLFLGSVFIFTGTVWCLFVAAIAATASQKLQSSSKALHIAKRATGLAFVGLGIKLAIQVQR